MRRDRRDERRRDEARAQWRAIMLPVAVLVFLAIGAFTVYQVGDRAPKTDDILCPLTGPVGATVLLLDTSDPLTPDHRAKLDSLVEHMAEERPDRMGIKPEMGIKPGELLVVYEMTQKPGEPKQLIKVCRPHKNPKYRDWFDEFFQGEHFAKREWKRFKGALDNLFPKDESEPQQTSPLLETIKFLAARHVPGKLGDERFKVHLILFSDLLQHTPKRFSHYESYPPAKDLPRDLRADLTGARVSLFRLERPEYSKLQTPRHYYWWTEMIQELGGRIEWQDSI